MPPSKRMSDILASSSIDSRIASPSHVQPQSSDGPTLPLLGASTSNDRKRKRAAVAPQVIGGVDGERGVGERGGVEKGGEAKKGGAGGAHQHHPTLYEPWVLLPPRLRREVEGRGGAGVSKGKGASMESEKVKGQGRENRVEVVVFGKNQNIKAGVNRLKKYISSSSREDGAKTGGLLAVSAQGPATVKLVGIFEVVRRVLATPTTTTEQGGGQEEEGKEKHQPVTWYTYPVLSHVVLTPPRRNEEVPSNRAQSNEVDTHTVPDAMDIDIDIDATTDADTHNVRAAAEGAVRAADPRRGHGGADAEKAADGKAEQDRDGEDEKKKIIPVLTLWISRTRMQSFGDAVGEGEVRVG
ncbi:hypothetical protein N0V95_010063 [Ascochyta clinopodiicola]|nr:hypothetical protein N0V95_010063 [Ascochyta clinopodiicola]